MPALNHLRPLTWSVDSYILRALRADSPKTPLATSVLLSRHVPRHHPGISLVCWWLPSRKPSPTVEQSLLLPDVTCVCAVYHYVTRACADIGLLRQPAGLPRDRCSAMPRANPSQYFEKLFPIIGQKNSGTNRIEITISSSSLTSHFS
jgi:hypothetical protein